MDRRKARQTEMATSWVAPPPIRKPKTVTGRGVHRDQLLQLRKTDMDEYVKQVAAPPTECDPAADGDVSGEIPIET